MKTYRWLQLVLLFGIAAFIFILGLVFFRRELLQFYLVRTFSSLANPAHLIVARANLNDIELHNITVGERTSIPYLRVDYDLFAKGSKIKKIRLTAKSIDLKVLKELAETPSPKTSDKRDSVATGQSFFSQASESCSNIMSSEIDLSLEQLLWGEQEFAVNLRLERKEPTHLDLRLNGALHRTVPGQPHRGQFAGHFSLLCGPDRIRLDLKEFAADFQDFFDGDTKTQLNLLNISFKPSFVEIANDERLRFDLEVAAEAKYTKSGIDGSAQWDLARLKGELPLSAPAPDPDVAPGTFNFDIRNLRVQKNPDLVFHFAELKSRGRVWTEESHTRTSIDLWDNTKTFDLRNIVVDRRSGSGEIRIALERKDALIRFNPRSTAILPSLPAHFQIPRGRLGLNGEIVIQDGRPRGALEFHGKDIDVFSKEISIRKLVFAHDIIDFETWTSRPRRSIQAHEVDFGEKLHDLSIQYQLFSADRIHFDSVAVTNRGAEFRASPFTFALPEKELSQTRIEIRNLGLERMLVLGLGENVKAQGQLSGKLQVLYHGNKPSITGRLKAEEAGWIRYRDGRAAPRKNIQLSDGAMEILHSYLYDFHYENLEIEIDSDERYETKMRLRTLGRNPDYLDGKQLKLNVNIEQNLLAALRAMMLTYDLPNRIKEHLEKTGSK